MRNVHWLENINPMKGPSNGSNAEFHSLVFDEDADLPDFTKIEAGDKQVIL